MRILMIGAAFFLLGVFSGCAGQGTLSQGSEEASSARNVITSGEVAEAMAYSSTAHDVVRRLKPEWLRKRSPRTTTRFEQQQWEGDIQVYLNGQRMGGSDNLYNISAEVVREASYLNAAEATRYGMGHQHGAIMVQTW